MNKSKLAALLSIVLLVAWVFAAISDAFGSVWMNVVAAIIPILPVLVVLAAVGLPKAQQEKNSKESDSDAMLLVHSGAMVAAVSTNILSSRLAALVDAPMVTLAVSLLAIPIFIAWVGVEAWRLSRQDEFHRRVTLETLAIAYALGLVFVFSVDMSQRSGFLLDWQASELLWPWLAIAWLPAMLIARRRYQE